MCARVLRIGQLSGDSASGIWNDTEAIALMVRSVLATGCLPALEERPSWLPVDACARACVDLAIGDGREGDEGLVYHLVNPRTFSWKDDLLPALQKHERLPAFEVVSPREWLERLEQSEQDPEKNPSIKLLEFWKGKYGGAVASTGGDQDDAPAGLTFETMKTR